MTGNRDEGSASGFATLVTDRRRALLTAALGFLQLRRDPPEVVMLRRCLDSWRGLGDVVGGLNAQGYDVELRQFPRGWCANLYPTGTAHSIVVSSAWEPTPWRCSGRDGTLSGVPSQLEPWVQGSAYGEPSRFRRAQAWWCPATRLRVVAMLPSSTVRVRPKDGR